MKSDFHFHFYTRIVIMAVLAVSLFFIQKSVRTSALINAYPYEITGWAWNTLKDVNGNDQGLGWVSLNCFNDFETPGEYESKCPDAAPPDTPGIAYGLEVDTTGNVSGCIWGGSDVSGGGTPLGWICFSDPAGISTQAPTNGIATSSDPVLLNAVDPTAFASILSQEDWRCTGTTAGLNDGLNCLKVNEATDCPGGTCQFTEDHAWKLQFPIQDSANADYFDATTIGAPREAAYTESSGGPIEGCFNCYDEYTYGCSLDPGDGCSPDIFGDCPPINIEGVPTLQTCSVVTGINKKCDNCLEYYYYSGRCERSDGGSAQGDIASPYIECASNADCTVADEDCEEISTCDSYIGTLNEKYVCTHNTLPTKGCATAAGCVSREIGSLHKVIGGYNCSQCNIEDDTNTCGASTYDANINSCVACEETYYTPGLMIDHGAYNIDTLDTIDNPLIREKANICGWGWNAWDSGNTRCSISGESPCTDAALDCSVVGDTCEPGIQGLGWFQFGPRVVTSTKPYISVESGNIYSQKGITSNYAPPFSRYNASYLIESGGSISNFVSSSTLSVNYQGELPYNSIIQFPALSDGKYSNALGTIDYRGMVTDVDPSVALVNKYGSIIDQRTGGLWYEPLLDDGVIHYTGPFDIWSTSGIPITIQAGVGSESGAGVIVVEGNFWTVRNFTYASAPVGGYDNIRNIPSVVWIIKGDFLIGHQVSELAGTFIVLGADGVGPCDPENPAFNCGKVDTCYEKPGEEGLGYCDDRSLTINGNVIAKYFELDRTWTDPDSQEPAEKFINDGRLHINPPPGFKDFSSIIPRFSDN